MGYVEAVLLGLVQGLTEFLPVSSSGHLALGHLLFGYRAAEGSGGAKAFDVLLHVATLVVICGAFWRIFRRLLTEQRHLLPRFAAALVPTGIVGVFLRRRIEALDRSPAALAGFFALTGAVLWSLRRLDTAATDTPAADENKAGGGDSAEEARNTGANACDLCRVGWGTALWTGLAQAAAILPGVSRSGSTIVAARWSGLAPTEAVAFSFVLGAPAILGAAVIKGKEIEALASAAPGPLAAGFVAALLSGWVALGFLRRLADGGFLHRFAPYCWFLAALCAYAAWK